MKTTSVAVLFLLALCYATSARGQTPAWTRQLGTSSFDENSGVSSDGLGSVYISGWTDGSFDGTNAGERDAFVAKYNASGTLEWTRQLGTSDLDGSLGVSADGVSSVYMSGTTWGNLEGTNVGRSDAFLSKYDTNGNLQWTRQFGTGAFDYSSGVSSDGLGSVYVTGVTEGRLDGTRAGVRDVFVAKYDASGTLQWTRQFGTSGNDASGGVSADGLGSVYISGTTDGSLKGQNAGDFDAFVAKFRIDFPTDLDFDGDSDGDDVDSLVGEIVAGTNNSAFDLTADAIVDNADLSQWLSDAATANGFTAPYLLGDANLDGSVNASDLNILGQNWLASPDTWQFGDFNADGIVNAGDLNELAQNWQQAIPSAASPESVPEPSAIFLVLLGIMATSLLKHRRRSDRFSHVSNV